MRGYYEPQKSFSSPEDMYSPRLVHLFMDQGHWENTTGAESSVIIMTSTYRCLYACVTPRVCSHRFLCIGESLIDSHIECPPVNVAAVQVFHAEAIDFSVFVGSLSF